MSDHLEGTLNSEITASGRVLGAPMGGNPLSSVSMTGIFHETDIKDKSASTEDTNEEFCVADCTSN